jgi:hypothetical protein
MATRVPGKRKQSRTGQGVRLQSQSKEIIYKVYTYFKKNQEKTKVTARNGAFDRTLEATGYLFES